MPLMTLVNQVGRLHATRLFAHPRKRQRRSVRWAVLRRLGALIRCGRIVRFQRTLVCLPEHRARSSGGGDRSVSAKMEGSTVARRNSPEPGIGLNSRRLRTGRTSVKPKPLSSGSPASREPSVERPSADEIHGAACAMARIPRDRNRPLTGSLHGVRMRRLTPVNLPGGVVQDAYVVRRGWVYVVLPDTPEYQGRLFDRYPKRDVQIHRSPHAVLLGRLKKGVRERPSLKKQKAARQNGCKPPRRGSRPRGRPRNNQASAMSPSVRS